MAAKPFVAASDASVVVSRPTELSTVFADYWAMTKPEVNFLIGITTAASFYLASEAELTRFPWMSLLHTLVGTTTSEFISETDAEHTNGRMLPLPIGSQATRARGPCASITCISSIGIVAAEYSCQQRARCTILRFR
jgi:hypothetical protein